MRDVLWGVVYFGALSGLVWRLSRWLRRHAPPRDPEDDPTEIDWP